MTAPAPPVDDDHPSWPNIGTAQPQGARQPEDLTPPVPSAEDYTAPPLRPRPGGLVRREGPPPDDGDGRGLSGRSLFLVALALVVLSGSICGVAAWALMSTEPSSAYAGVAGKVVPLGVVPERGAISAWRPDAPELLVPVIHVEAPLGQGADAGPGPVVLPGTPWPGERGRSVIAVNADLAQLRPGDQVFIGDQSAWVVTKAATVGEGDLALVTAQGEAVELALLEAQPFRLGQRTIVYAWRVA